LRLAARQRITATLYRLAPVVCAALKRLCRDPKAALAAFPVDHNAFDDEQVLAGHFMDRLGCLPPNGLLALAMSVVNQVGGEREVTFEVVRPLFETFAAARITTHMREVFCLMCTLATECTLLEKLPGSSGPTFGESCLGIAWRFIEACETMWMPVPVPTACLLTSVDAVGLFLGTIRSSYFEYISNLRLVPQDKGFLYWHSQKLGAAAGAVLAGVGLKEGQYPWLAEVDTIRVCMDAIVSISFRPAPLFEASEPAPSGGAGGSGNELGTTSLVPSDAGV